MGTRDELNKVTKYQAFCNEMRSDGLSGLWMTMRKLIYIPMNAYEWQMEALIKCISEKGWKHVYMLRSSYSMHLR